MGKPLIAKHSNWIVIAIFAIQLIECHRTYGTGENNGGYDYGYGNNQYDFNTVPMLEYPTRETSYNSYSAGYDNYGQQPLLLENSPSQARPVDNVEEYKYTQQYLLEGPKSSKPSPANGAPASSGKTKRMFTKVGSKIGILSKTKPAESIPLSDDPQKAFEELYKSSRSFSKDEVVARLRIIRGSEFAQQAAIEGFSIDALIGLSFIEHGKCTKPFMMKFNDVSEKVGKRKEAVYQYVVQTYKEQLEDCKQAAKEAVVRFQRSNQHSWPIFMELYHELRRDKKVSVDSGHNRDSKGHQYEITEAMDRVLGRIGRDPYQAVTDLLAVCRMFKGDKLVELLDIQWTLNYEEALADKDLHAYFTYLNLCGDVGVIRHWGRGLEEKMLEKTSWAGFHKGADYVDDLFRDVPVARGEPVYHQDPRQQFVFNEYDNF